MGESATSRSATFVGKMDWSGDARLYRLAPPLSVPSWDNDKPLVVDHVIVSAVVAPITGPETYIFPAEANGGVISYGELEGSFRGALDHEAALRGAGYEIVA